MTRGQAREIQRELLRAYMKAVDLELALRQEGRDDEASQARRRADALRRQVDALRRLAWRRWRGRAGALTERIRANNRKLQRAIRRVEGPAEGLADLSLALGLLDEAIRLATGLGSRS